MNDLKLYYPVQKLIKTGDPLLWHANTMLGAFIRAITRKERRQYEIDNNIDGNHTSGVLRMPLFEMGDRRWIAESLEHGPQLSLLSNRLTAFDGMVWWYPMNLPDEVRNRWGSNVLNLSDESIPYGYWDIAKYLLSGPPDIGSSKGIFCSEEWLIGLEKKGKACSPNGLASHFPEFDNVIPVRIL